MEQIGVIAIAEVGAHPERAVIATSRAGATGCLTIDGPNQVPQTLLRLDFISRFTDRPVAILLSSVTPSDIIPLTEWQGVNPIDFIIAASEAASLDNWAKFFSDKSLDFTVQVARCVDGVTAAQIGAKCIVLKGAESGGFTADETAFVLTQKWSKTAAENIIEIPFFVQGGIGLNTAAAAVAGGASGVVLDSQLLLARESELDTGLQTWIRGSDGSEITNVKGWNFFHRPNCEVIKKLQTVEIPSSKTVAELLAGTDGNCYRFGQDVCLAAPLAEQFVTVGGIVQGIQTSVTESMATAAQLRHLGEDSEFAAGHGIKYPILQGPMTRVSDTAAFAHAVSSNGGLSFLALAVMRKAEVENLLSEAKPKLHGMSWGVGILGFLPAEIRAEQTEAILKHKPPYAIIAGGRPDQAKKFEDEGIATYLHVPSPGLLTTFLRQGAKRFIFEGRECGGHVGPRSSFALWQSACDIIIEQFDKKPIKDLHLVFAGGIHDEISSAMIAAMTAPLAKRGVKIGLLMGTAYLFTKEAVESGAIVARFQKEALECSDTVLLQTGPGHAIRCVKTPYCETFQEEKLRLEKEGASKEDIVRNLEGMNIGRLRVASKGVDRKKSENSATRMLVGIPEEEQYDRGMYMIGQIAALEDKVISMADLHERVSNGGMKRLDSFATAPAKVISEPKPASDVAIIGMSCFYPDANSLEEYWHNILDRHSAVREIPETHWDWRLFYDEDPKTKDRIVSKWGGFVKDIPFDPLRYGITPKSMEAIEPLQLLSLEAVHHALIDAGYEKRPFNRDKTACIVGIGGGAGPKSVAYGFRTCMRLADFFEDMPIYSDEIISRAGKVLPEWTEDSFPGFLSNICSGRVSNRFNFGGSNYAIDAACASSLASLDACVRELESGDADMAIAMGSDAVQTPFSYMAFSKTHALSRQGRSRPFDAEGDGIVLSEGVGVVVLKRLADAERDGDRIYAVIKGVGSSSDGKALGLTAPNALGQIRALDRAYQKANVRPDEVELIEAHGTGTVVGDRTEATSLSTVMHNSGARRQSCALGSVKSMIGHTKCAAGIAGLIKTAKALHHKVIPPTLVETPNPTANFGESALYLNTQLRPWVHNSDSPRIAGVSAFGFGGTNYHTVLSEYKSELRDNDTSVVRQWPTELFFWRDEKEKLSGELAGFITKLKNSQADLHLGELAAAVNRKAQKSGATVAIVAKSREDLLKKLDTVSRKIASSESYEDPTGILYREKPAKIRKTGFLFAGQGSQYPNMLADLAVNFPCVREAVDLADSIVSSKLPKPLGQYIYPPSSFSGDEEQRSNADLAQTEVAQPALGACGTGMARLLAKFGIQAEAFAGHSYGEFAAMHAGGVISEAQLYEISFLRGQAIRDHLEEGSAMLAIKAGAAEVRELITDEPEIYLANINSPTQTVVSLAESKLVAFQEKLTAKAIESRRIPVACGFHSPFVEKASSQLEQSLERLTFAGDTDNAIYSNHSTKRYPTATSEQKSLLARHLTGTVDFQGMLETMHTDGVDLFIELGPGSVLSGLCREIFGDTEVYSLSTDQKGRHGVTQIQFLLGKLLTLGLTPDTGYLSRIRNLRTVSVDKILNPTESAANPNMWMVNGVRSKPVNQPEPLLLGQPHPNLKKDQIEKILKSEPVKKAPKKSTPEPTPPKASKPENPISMKNGHSTPATTQPVYTNGNGHHPTPQPVAHPQGADQVMLGFQNLMSQFLDTQRAIMTAYLNGDTSAPTMPVAQAPLPQIQPRPAVAPAPAPTPVTDGSQSNSNTIFETKRSIQPTNGVTQNGGARVNTVKIDEPKVEKPAPAEADSTSEVSIEAVNKHLLEIVGERTGYPEEMLDADLDLEADLGIDSIKRVEILGELAEFIMPNSTDMGEESNLDLEKLSSLRSLQQIIDYLKEFLESSKMEKVANGDAKKKLKA
ncbi:MAG: beta-ketoacyl synthase N-terminal-like domain-containing protein [Verrucomicrobiales bacterium]|nr:beta-ketoacyl synthase N-terminal-like domain-containing protein [Verrucomicrobiales bacterium]